MAREDSLSVILGTLENYLRFIQFLVRVIFPETDRDFKMTALKRKLVDLESKNFEKSVEIMQALSEKLSQLSYQEKKFLRVSYQKDLSSEEAAREFDVSSAIVEAWKAQIRVTIRSELASFRSSDLPKTLIETEGYNEVELINKINSIFPSKKRKKYDSLYAKLQGGKLTEEERIELLKLSDEFELLNAERLKYIGKLADKRGISLPEAIKYVEA